MNNRKFQNSFERKTSIREYQPNSQEEYLVWEIAKHVGDSDMRPLLKVLRTNGYSLIESAFLEFRNLEDVVQFKNKPGFLMHLIKKRVEGGENNG